MSFHLTPTITISTATDLEAALEELASEGVDDEWLDQLRRGAEPHLECEHGLVAACYDARCRPPTSGGTGGSLPRGTAAPRRIAKSKAPDAPSGERFFMSEFGSSIRKMIESEPALAGLRRSVLDEAVAKAQAEQDEKIDEMWQEAWSNPSKMLSRVNIGKRHYGTWENIPQERIDRENAEWNAFVDAKKNLPNILKNGPSNDVERRLLEAIEDRRTTTGDDRYKELRITTENNISIVLQADVRQEPVDPTKLVDVTPETEAAVRRVGEAIHKEIDARVDKLYDDDFEIRNHTEAVNEVVRLVKEVDPTYERRNISFQTFTGDGIPTIFITPPSADAVEMFADHPVRDKIKEVLKERGISESSYDSHRTKKINPIHREVLAQVLEELRPMGGELRNLPRHRTPQRGLSSNQQLTGATKMYPKDWIDASNAGNSIGFRQTQGRAHYAHRANQVYGSKFRHKAELTLDGSHGTAVHELAHRMEYTVPGVRALERQFFTRRAGQDPIEKMGKGYRRDEETAPDTFFDRYVGKLYSDAFEVLSMGWEHMQYHAGWVRVDQDHGSFVLGTLATVYREG